MFKRPLSPKFFFRLLPLTAFCLCIAAGVPRASFQSSIHKRLKATVIVSNDTSVPRIDHVALQRISPVTRIGLITGAVRDNNRIAGIDVYYRAGSQLAWSTYTAAGVGQKSDGQNSELEQLFSFKLPDELLTGDCEYRIAAYDGANIAVFPASGWQRIYVTPSVRSSVESKGGAIIVHDGNASDGETSLTLPDGALRGQQEITITEFDPADTGIPPGNRPASASRPAAVYRFEPAGLAFAKPARLQLLFQDTDNNGIVDGADYPIADLRIMWWDGFEWRLINSTVDRTKKLVTASIRHFSYYAVFPVGALNDDDYRCREKIITPANQDGRNDFAFFGMLGENDTVNIYNTAGKRVRKIAASESAWDGRDDDGAFVSSGIYLYQIRINGKTISGTIVVAK